MRSLITGVNGFVGSYLSRYLLDQRGLDLYGTILNNNLERVSSSLKKIYTLDITNKAQIKQILKDCKPNYIFHLAAQSSPDISWKYPQKTINVNINGTINLLDSIRELNLKTKILLIGSSEEYGVISEDEVPINEKQELRPENPYSLSKLAQSYLGQMYVKAYGMDIIIARAFNHIGPNQSPIFVASDFAKRIVQIEKNFLPPELLVGNLEAQRDFTDVRDVVMAYYDILRKGKSGEIYNVGTGKCYKIKYILDCLLSLTKVKIRIIEDPNRIRPLDTPITKCDNTKLKNTITWEPKYQIEDTLKEMLQYWRNNLDYM